MIKDFLLQRREGFSGVAHVEIAIMLLLILLLIPIEPFSSYVHIIMSSPWVGAMAFFIISGAALLPDLDNLKRDGGSAAAWDLGFLGTLLSSVMVTISSVMTSIFHRKGDMNIPTQHRFFWHTALIPLVLFLCTYFFFMPAGDVLVAHSFDTTSFIAFFEHSSFMVCFVLFLIAISIYTGSLLLLRKFIKVIPIHKWLRVKPTAIAFVLMVASVLFCIFGMTLSDLQFISYCVVMGYAFHLIGDMFADSGIPLLFPLTGLPPIRKFWVRQRFLPRILTVSTGSTFESICKIVFLAIDIVLAIALFCPQLFQSFA